MRKWEFPPITDKMIEEVNKEFEKDKKAQSNEPAYVQLGLMNGEIIKIPLSDIECLQVFGVSENHYITNEFPFLEKYKFCAKAFLKLSKEVTKKNMSFNNKTTILDRLTSYNDISDISYLNIKGRLLDRILVPWTDMSHDERENGHQFSRVDRQGNLEIIIKGD